MRVNDIEMTQKRKTVISESPNVLHFRKSGE